MYLKLDKKLILKAQKIEFVSDERSKTNVSLQSIKKNLYLINLIPKYFEYIELEALVLHKQKIQFYFAHNLFTLITPKFKLDTTLKYDKNRIYANIKRLVFQKYKTAIQGRAIATTKDFLFKGRFNTHNIEGNLHLSKIGDIIKIYLKSKPFTNRQLQNLFAQIPVNKEIEAWSCKKIRAQKYRLEFFKGIIDLKKGFDPNLFQGRAVAYNGIIDFQKGIKPVLVKKIILDYKNNNLYFTLHKPTFQKRSLQGSKVTIYHLGKTGSYIDIFIKMKTKFDKEIKKVLVSYNVHVPIIHKKGVLDSKVEIKLYFHDYSTDIQGSFTTKNSLIHIQNFDLFLHTANFSLHNKLITIHPSLVSLTPIVQAKIHGTIDLYKEYAKLNLNEAEVSIKKKNQIILMADNLTEELLLDLKRAKAHLKKFNTDIYFYRHTMVQMNDLTLIKPYSPILQKIDPQRGWTKITIDEPVRFEAKLVKKNSIFYENGKNIDHFFIRGRVGNAGLSININHKISLSFKNKKIDGSLKNLDLRLDLLFEKKKEINQPSFNDIRASLKLFNTKILYKKRILPIEFGHLIYRKKIHFTGNYGPTRYALVYQNNHFNLSIKTMHDEILHKLFGMKFLSQGEYELTLRGPLNKIKGHFLIQRAYIKNLKAFNNLFAFINSVPALITFQNPGFSTKGLFIKNGYVNFIYSKDLLYIKKLHLVSNSTTFDGEGIIDLKANKIGMVLQLKTLKSVTNIVNKIPVAGYILLGKDGSVSTTIKITGDLDNPKIKTQTLKDTLHAPLNIIKRTLLLPFKLFD
ncbi:hypothetical protein NitYY0814_C0908 [Nitratiruptor sp. YY08-14]|nr:hypothetical protein NitYY0810_C1213 [Nitratiruptor sp. YY08-10]BCD64063.1 hypothetical protein NitYY0814_C0908 [Nitratiruptor sp. YY08-14]